MTRTNIKIGLDVGDAVTAAGQLRVALGTIDEAMKKVKVGSEEHAKLAYEKDRMQARAAGFDRNLQTMANNPRLQGIGANGLPVWKMDEKNSRLMETQIDTTKKLITAMTEAIGSGKVDEAMAISTQLDKTQREFSKAVGDTTGIGAREKSEVNTIKSIFAQQMISAVNSGLQITVSSLDRSGVINAYGQGDIMGGSLAEKQRKANLHGGIAQIGLTSVGTVAGAMLGNPMLGSMIGNALGNGVSNILQAGVNKEATEIAYAGLWSNQADKAMNLAAITGNPNNVRETWGIAADSAARYGYSADEGIEAIKQAVQQGLSNEVATALTQEIFKYERNTGADRSTLTSISNLSARYGGGDALSSGWAGLRASGMRAGQYSEYLRAMQRVMEDGISRGFIRSSDEVAKNLTMLASLTNNSPLWQGELGARRLLDMNAGLENATGLQSTSDIIAFRAAMNIAEGKNGGPVSYIEGQKILEGGITPELFKEYMSLTSSAEGGNREGILERMRQTFGLKYTATDELYNSWNSNKTLTDSQLQTILDKYKNTTPEADNAELRAAVYTASTTEWWTKTGQVWWDRRITMLETEFVKAIKEYNRTTGSYVPIPALPPIISSAPAIPRSLDDKTPPLAITPKETAATGKTYSEWVNDRQAAAARNAEIDKMLIQAKGGKNSTFFTGNGNLLTKNDDEESNKRFIAYRGSGANKDQQEAFYHTISRLETLTEAERKYANDTDMINRAIPDIKSDITGDLLIRRIEELIEAVKNTTTTVNVP